MPLRPIQHLRKNQNTELKRERLEDRERENKRSDEKMNKDRERKRENQRDSQGDSDIENEGEQDRENIYLLILQFDFINLKITHLHFFRNLVQINVGQILHSSSYDKVFKNNKMLYA